MSAVESKTPQDDEADYFLVVLETTRLLTEEGYLVAFVQTGRTQWTATVRRPDQDLTYGIKGKGDCMLSALLDACWRGYLPVPH